MKKTHKAFTLIELIFIIVIIGVLSSFAIPRFRGMSANAKISAEIATMSSVLTALEEVNGEWSINEGTFNWGIGTNSSSNPTIFNMNTGYPRTLNSPITNQTFGRIIRINSSEYTTQYSDNNITIFTGPASSPTDGVSSANERENRPDQNDYWIYAFNTPVAGCRVNTGTPTARTKVIFPGDFVLIDVGGTATTDYSTITCN
jgi:prepilin-type N-terminal cleavage/methylation domain-containing protein